MDKKESRVRNEESKESEESGVEKVKKVKSLRSQKSRKKIPILSRLVTQDSQDFERKTDLVFFRHPKLDNPQKGKSYYRVEHTPEGIRIWSIN